MGNGSDEVLAFAFYAFFDTMNGDLLFPEFTYSFYPVYGDLFGIRYKKTPLAPNFNIDLARMIEHAPSSGVIFPNPNAPTGILISIDQIRKFLDAYRKDRRGLYRFWRRKRSFLASKSQKSPDREDPLKKPLPRGDPHRIRHGRRDPDSRTLPGQRLL